MHTTATLHQRPQTEPTAEASETPATTHPLNSQDLLRGQSAVSIAHNGSVYRLQATRQGKLILTK